MSVIDFSNKLKEKQMLEEHKAALLAIVESLKAGVEDGTIKEFVGVSIDDDGELKLYVGAMDLPGGVGLFEIGKTLLIQDQL